MSLQPTSTPESYPKSQQASVNAGKSALCRCCGQPFRLDHWAARACPDCRSDEERLKAWAQRHQTELFPNPSPALDQGRADRDQAHADPALVDRLVRLLREYARTVPEVDMGAFRIWLDKRGVALPTNRNFLGRLPIMAGLHRTDRVTQSAHEKAKGRIVRIWTLSENQSS